MTNHFTFPFKHFNTGIINGEGTVMTPHDPSEILNLSNNESKAIRSGSIKDLDDMVSIRMAFHDQVDDGDGDFHTEKSFMIAQAIAAVRNKRWFETNDDLTIPHVSRMTAEDEVPFLWHEAQFTFTNTDQLYQSMDGNVAQVPVELDSDMYRPRKVLEVITNTFESRGIKLTIEMIPEKVTFHWTANEWHSYRIKELTHRFMVDSSEVPGKVQQIFPAGVSDRIIYIHALFMKEVADKFVELMYNKLA